MTFQQAFTVLIALVAIERIAELFVSQRNLRWSRSHGGIEFGLAHYPFMVVLHLGLLVGALVEVWVWPHAIVPAVSWVMLAVVLAAQALRWWCIATLGRRWNTRIVIVPDLPRVTGGPYRLMSHPNYLAVVVEGFALPMVGFAWVTAIAFTALNLPLLAVRIRAEDAALATLPAARR